MKLIEISSEEVRENSIEELMDIVKKKIKEK